MTNTLDPREVLMCLNDMGYRNITSLQLKEFIKDLRKLIKYEEQFCSNHNEGNYEHSKESKVKFDKNSNHKELLKNNSASAATVRTTSESAKEKSQMKHQDLKVRQRKCENKKSSYEECTFLNCSEKDGACKESLQIIRSVSETEKPQNKPKQKEESNSARTSRKNSLVVEQKALDASGKMIQLNYINIIKGNGNALKKIYLAKTPIANFDGILRENY